MKWWLIDQCLRVACPALALRDWSLGAVRDERKPLSFADNINPYTNNYTNNYNNGLVSDKSRSDIPHDAQNLGKLITTVLEAAALSLTNPPSPSLSPPLLPPVVSPLILMYQPLLESILFDFFSFLQPPLGHNTFRQKYSSFPKKYEHLRKKEGVGGNGGREKGRWTLPPCVAFFEEREESLGFLVRCLERGGRGEREGKVGFLTFLRESPRYFFIFFSYFIHFLFFIFYFFFLCYFFLFFFIFYFYFIFIFYFLFFIFFLFFSCFCVFFLCVVYVCMCSLSSCSFLRSLSCCLGLGLC